VSAWLDDLWEGMRTARVNGHDLARIQSVAPFFVSRMDTEVDRLEAIGSSEALAPRGYGRHRPFPVYTEAFARPSSRSAVLSLISCARAATAGIARGDQRVR
jgi:hypothetical protein